MDIKIKSEFLLKEESEECEPESSSKESPPKKSIPSYQSREFKILRCGCCKKTVHLRKGRREVYCSMACFTKQQNIALKEETKRLGKVVADRDAKLAERDAKLAEQHAELVDAREIIARMVGDAEQPPLGNLVNAGSNNIPTGPDVGNMPHSGSQVPGQMDGVSQYQFHQPGTSALFYNP